MKKKDLIIVIIFISFLVLPSILFWFVKDKFDNTNYENRTLSSKPEFTFKDNDMIFCDNYMGEDQYIQFIGDGAIQIEFRRGSL